MCGHLSRMFEKRLDGGSECLRSYHARLVDPWPLTLASSSDCRSHVPGQSSPEIAMLLYSRRSFTERSVVKGMLRSHPGIMTESGWFSAYVSCNCARFRIPLSGERVLKFTSRLDTRCVKSFRSSFHGSIPTVFRAISIRPS